MTVPVAAAAATSFGGPRGGLLAGQNHLTVVPGEPRGAPALVDAPTLAPVDACHDAMAWGGVQRGEGW